MRELCLLMVIAVAGGASRWAEAADSVDGFEQFDKMREKYNAESEKFYKETIRDVTDDAERARLYHFHPANTMVEEFLSFEEQHRGEIVAVSTLHHLVSVASGGYGWDADYACTEGGRKSLDILTEHYGDHKDLDVFFSWLGQAGGVREVRTLLRRALESPHRHVRGNALFKLATISARESEIPRWMDANLELVGDDPGLAKWAAHFRKVRQEFDGVDVHVSRREAIQMCDRVTKEYGDVLESPRTTYGLAILRIGRGAVDPLVRSNRRTLSELVEPLRFGLLNLAIGQVPPDIEGPDAFGNDLKLSDQRGKVTVLMFSFKGCGPCEGMYPTNRELIETYRGRPFAFVGVMGDDELATVQKSVKAGAITWPVWWDGGKRGPIHRRWNVDAWPEIYVMDHKGIIRYRELIRGELLKLAVARLIKEAEASQTKVMSAQEPFRQPSATGIAPGAAGKGTVGGRPVSLPVWAGSAKATSFIQASADPSAGLRLP